MRNFILLFIFGLLSLNSFAGTCTTISRVNNSPNTELTSTKYNLDHNTAYAAINAFDGGCITSGTLEADALNSTDFAFLNKGVHQGCEVSKSNASTVSVDRCHLSLNGNFVSTTSANTESFGCSGCSSETTSTFYYVYAKSDSSGTTLNLLLLTSAPNADGFDGSGNKVLGKIFNDSSGDIDDDLIQNWKVSSLEDPYKVRSAFITNSGTPTFTRGTGSWISNLTDNNTGDTTLTFETGVFTDIPDCTCSISAVAAGARKCCYISEDTAQSSTTLRIVTEDCNTGTDADTNFIIMCNGK